MGFKPADGEHRGSAGSTPLPVPAGSSAQQSAHLGWQKLQHLPGDTSGEPTRKDTHKMMTGRRYRCDGCGHAFTADTPKDAHRLAELHAPGRVCSWSRVEASVLPMSEIEQEHIEGLHADTLRGDCPRCAELDDNLAVSGDTLRALEVLQELEGIADTLNTGAYAWTGSDDPTAAAISAAVAELRAIIGEVWDR